MRFKHFYEMAFSTGAVPPEHKAKLEFDNVDKDLYLKFANNKSHAAKVILARYGYLRRDLQQQAIQSGVYFKDVNTNAPSSPGILVINGKEEPIDTHIKELRDRVGRLIPLFTRWGSRNPAAKTGIDYDRLNKGFILNYHAKTYYKSDSWKGKFTDVTTNAEIEFKSEHDFINNFKNGYRNFNINLGNKAVSVFDLRNDIIDKIKNAVTNRGLEISDNINLNDLILPIMDEVLHKIYVKMGAIEQHKHPFNLLNHFVHQTIKDRISVLLNQGNRYRGSSASSRYWVQGKGDLKPLKPE